MASYCPSCGEELDGEAAYCPNCGNEIESGVKESDTVPTESDDTADSSDDEGWRQYSPESYRIGIAGIVFGFVIGGLIAWSLAEIGGSGIGFLIGLLLGTGYLWQKRTATGAIGSGLYISALLLILVPILFYGGMLAEVGDEPQTAEEAGQAIGGVAGLVIWGFVFFLIAIVVSAVGYYFKKREKRKLEPE